MTPTIEGETPPDIRVFVLDDYELVRRGLIALLKSAAPDIVVVGEAATAAEALSLLPAAHPDVALLDIVLPDGNGMAVCREIRARHPDIHCLMLTAHQDEEALLASVLGGASGYFVKGLPAGADDFVDGIRRAAAGATLLDPFAVRDLVDRLTGPKAAQAAMSGDMSPSPDIASLTSRERQMLELVVARRTNASIAQTMKLTQRAVEVQLSVIFTKIGLERRMQAAAHGTRIFRSATVSGSPDPVGT